MPKSGSTLNNSTNSIERMISNDGQYVVRNMTTVYLSSLTRMHEAATRKAYTPGTSTDRRKQQVLDSINETGIVTPTLSGLFKRYTKLDQKALLDLMNEDKVMAYERAIRGELSNSGYILVKL